MIIDTQSWAPDAAALGNPGCVRAENVLPRPTGFAPIPSLASATGSLDARPRGAISVVDDNGTTHSYAGDETKLYRLVDTTWTDSSGGGGYTTGDGEIWEFVRWRNEVFATNFTQTPQTITLGATAFSALTTAFRARHIAVVREYVVAANTWDAGDGNVVDRVRWSAANNPTDWTVSSTTGADVRDLNVGGAIQRVLGGEYGVIVSERSVHRMTFTGSPTFFQLDEVLPGFGAVSPGAVAQYGDRVFFLSENGFVMLIDGATPAFIGSGRVDQTVLRDLDFTNVHRVTTAIDAQGARVLFAYPGAGSDGTPNRIVIYDWGLDRWSYAAVEVELLWRAAGIGISLEGVDAINPNIDFLEIPLDSVFWDGANPRIGAFGTDFSLSFFAGTPLPATIETREVEPRQGQRSTITGVRALVDGGTVTARVGSRSNLSTPVTYASAGAQRDSGKLPVRTSGRYHRVELTINGTWTDVLGAQLDQVTTRASGRRG